MRKLLLSAESMGQPPDARRAKADHRNSEVAAQPSTPTSARYTRGLDAQPTVEFVEVERGRHDQAVWQVDIPELPQQQLTHMFGKSAVRDDAEKIRSLSTPRRTSPVIAPVGRQLSRAADAAAHVSDRLGGSTTVWWIPIIFLVPTTAGFIRTQATRGAASEKSTPVTDIRAARRLSGETSL